MFQVQFLLGLLKPVIELFYEGNALAMMALSSRLFLAENFLAGF